MANLQDNIDFLWDCSEYRDCSSYEHPVNYHLACTTLHPMSFTVPFVSDNDPISIATLETRGCGVFENVGNEIWEAAILLACFVYNHSNSFMDCNILELGCGVGLPSLLLIEMMRRGGKHNQVVLTDHDDEVLANIFASLQVSEKPCNIDAGVIVGIEKLDWLCSDTWNCPNSRSRECNVFIGSALCYMDNHSALADTIKYFMDNHACEKVYIIQVSDRAGFTQFVHRLSELDMSYSVEIIPEHVYSAAGEIQCHSSSPLVARDDSSDAVQVVKTYTFPRQVLHEAQNEQTRGDVLVRTAREEFSLLVICKTSRDVSLADS